jgi:ATP-dependent RNA helicase DDX31/DBP7
LREAPGRIGAAAGATNASAVAAAAGKKRKRGEQVNGATETEDGNDAPVEHLKGEKSARNSVEMRMYEAVRKQGRLTKVGGMMGEFAGAGDGKKQKTGFGVDPSRLAGGGGDYQVVGGGDLQKLVAGKRR